ncbi:MAG: hypothetical protein IH987_19030 [Planctomycetes bacterium]|nr:hypothetical protein [Planctomycetota bacterium]
MRGTINEAAYKLWREGRELLPITSQANFDKSLAKMKKAIALDGNFARAFSRLSYLYVTGVIDGWNFEPGWTDNKKLLEAQKLAKKAVKLDRYDYDTHWALAFVYLNRGNGQTAIQEYRKALKLDDNNMNLLAEMADALVYVGKRDEAIRKLMQARRIFDWHRWVLAWAYYFKGRKDKLYYDFAHDELRRMVVPPHHDRYPAEIMLLSAAVHVRMNKIGQAKEVMDMFKLKKPDWTVEKERKRGPALNRADEKHWLDALRTAGLPKI